MQKSHRCIKLNLHILHNLHNFLCLSNCLCSWSCFTFVSHYAARSASMSPIWNKWINGCWNTLILMHLLRLTLTPSLSHLLSGSPLPFFPLILIFILFLAGHWSFCKEKKNTSRFSVWFLLLFQTTRLKFKSTVQDISQALHVFHPPVLMGVIKHTHMWTRCTRSFIYFQQMYDVTISKASSLQQENRR